MQIITGVITHTNRIDKQCAEQFNDYSRSFWQNLIKNNAVKINDKIITDVGFMVKLGDNITAEIPEPIAAIPEPIAMDLAIRFEDDDIIVINKPAGLTVHPAPGHYDDTLVNGLLHHCKDSLSGIGGVLRPGIVHRLDKDTSGLIIIAKNDKSHQKLSQDFAIHAVNRQYIAIAWGELQKPSGIITTEIGRDPRNRQKQAVVAQGRERIAITHYQKLAHKYNLSLVKFRLETGRTHQVRVHAAHIGHSLLGDVIYGHAHKIPKQTPEELRELIKNFPRQALHATQINFIHPITNKPMEFHAPMPQDMQAIADFF